MRQFFFGGNCLCAPTAMIRREAYDAVGPYDPRLTNLQDFEMWIRMLVAGHDIHLLPEELTAFRIRDNNANMSASRPDSRLRHAFEMTKILKRFTELEPTQFEDAFGAEAAKTSTPDALVALRVAELARQNPEIAFQNFALQLLYESARDADDFDRLRTLSGSIDALGTHAIFVRDRHIEELSANLQSRDRSVSGLIEAVAIRDSRIAETTSGIAERDRLIAGMAQDLSRSAEEIARLGTKHEKADAEIAALGQQLATSIASIERMSNSLSWRSTSLARRIAHIVQRSRMILK